MMSKIKNQSVDSIKSCLSQLGLPVWKVVQDNSLLCVYTIFNYEDEPREIRLLLDAVDETLTIGIPYYRVPEEKRSVVHELISRINTLPAVCKYVMAPDTGMLVLQAGLCITDDILHEKDVLALLKRMLSDNHMYSRLIAEQVNSTSSPAEIMEKFLGDKNRPIKYDVKLEEE